ncbi:hypothetical protein ZEAMMB73_Zm00001d029646 [Zea mays]|uniref:Uncharacterized protein n=1 Tax=Zea mays TaxID=4577 RepID=A0A1D6K6K9_MAIZE|nr:hypothetical protein ZEAMMB73_Zm00001d048701 [Zea mays]AQK48539.1 hypothetical protein ZEAMMB73_Zm00001d048701 [Zea mays]AQK48548.1 hypothetical protein ZEAMMB73_Zm00001d048701 [Zea mays]AQK48555.1 hypothetical protein ZEAMMB73_Zm00001d048701 [Zea mays]AQK48569.1 hypothetical protein ZEAMMB73_Zm00001d048701 [Zea mays]
MAAAPWSPDRAGFHPWCFFLLWCSDRSPLTEPNHCSTEQMTRWPSSWRCGRRSWRCWASPLPSATSTPPSPRATRSTWCRRLPSFLSLPHPARLFHPLRPRLTFASDVCA